MFGYTLSKLKLEVVKNNIIAFLLAFLPFVVGINFDSIGDDIGIIIVLPLFLFLVFSIAINTALLSLNVIRKQRGCSKWLWYLFFVCSWLGWISTIRMYCRLLKHKEFDLYIVDTNDMIVGIDVKNDHTFIDFDKNVYSFDEGTSSFYDTEGNAFAIFSSHYES